MKYEENGKIEKILITRMTVSKLIFSDDIIGVDHILPKMAGRELVLHLLLVTFTVVE